MAHAYNLPMQTHTQMQKRATGLPWDPESCMRYIIVQALDRTKGSGDFSAPSLPAVLLSIVLCPVQTFPFS